MKNFKIIQLFCLFVGLVVSLNSCVNDDDFDVPPTGELQEIISLGGDTPVFNSCFIEDFESFSDGDTEFAQYENITTIGNRLWAVDEFSGNQFLRMSAFGSGGTNISYFVLPVNFDVADEFSFKTQDRFFNGNPLQVFLVSDYSIDEDIVTSATLSEITSSFTIAQGTTGSASQPFVMSGSYDLSGVTGNGFIAFKYSGEDNGVTTNMHIDEITLADNDDDDCDVIPATPCDVQDFSGFAEDATALTGYQNIAVEGSSKWQVREFSMNKYIQGSAFNAPGDVESWFVLGADFDVAQGFSFSSNHGFDNGAPLTVLYSTDYDEMGDVSTANWTEITGEFTISSGITDGFGSFETSGEYDLSALSGKGYVAFRYIGNGSGVTTTIQIDDITFTNDAGSGDCTFDLMEIIVPDPEVLLISELADPDNESGARFVEIYNPGGSDVDLTGWALRRWTNGNTDPQSDVALIGTIPAGGTFVISNNAATFMSTYGFAPGQDVGTGGAGDSNGDDQIALIDPTGTLVDMFGVPGEDGTGTNHEFEDGRAVRNATVMMGNPTYDFSEWMVFNDSGDAGTTNDPQEAPADFTPGMHPDSGGGGGANFELIISGVIDGPLSGGTPKAIELYVGMDIADLSVYGLGSANNGGGTDDQEFALSGSASAGDFIYVATESANFNAFFGFDPTFTDGFAAINGDDAVELFKDGAVIDTFGDIAVDGNGEPWEYTDGWAYRKNATMPDGGTFVLDNWTYSGANALDGETTNGTAATPFPIGTYTP